MYIDIDGLKTYYEIEGSGECVLFLHGFKGGVESFKGVSNALKEKFKVISLNFWGFDNNKSDIPKRTFFVKDYAKNVLLFLDKLNIDRVHIIAHSFGGRVAIYIAANYHERVNKIVLCDAAGIKPKKSLIKRFKVFKYKLLKLLVKCKILKRGCLEKYGSKDYKSLPPVMRQTFINVVNEDLQCYAKKITCPVLLVWGKNDLDTPLYMARALHKNIKDSGLIIYDAGHFAYLEKHKEFCAAVDYFLTH